MINERVVAIPAKSRLALACEISQRFAAVITLSSAVGGSQVSGVAK